MLSMDSAQHGRIKLAHTPLTNRGARANSRRLHRRWFQSRKEESSQIPSGLRGKAGFISRAERESLSLKSFPLQDQILRRRENPGNQTFCGCFAEGGNLNWTESLSGPWGSPKAALTGANARLSRSVCQDVVWT